MNTRITATLMFLVPAFALAQTPVDDNGQVVGRYESQADIMSIDGSAPLLSHAELQELVGPIALYPDDLLAIVLPASAYPLQIVEAARFLEALESDPGLKPDEDWDDAVVALLNYPEVLALLNEDLDWTLRLGDAVVAQQADVVAAVEAFRDRAYAAGNLKSDEHQTISDDDGVISISPVSEDVIYVPYYEPAKVVYYQPEPVYYYYPRPYPVYYYPYASNYSFRYGYFWGVTTAFSIGWYTDSLNVYHHSYYGHPYYGHTYWNHWYYRRPSINVYNNYYVNYGQRYGDRYSHGDHWRARESRREYVRREGYTRNENHDGERRQTYGNERGPRVPVSFRERDTQQLSRNTGSQVRSTRNTGGAANVAGQTRDVSRQNHVGQSRDDQRQGVSTQSRSTERSARTARSREDLSQRSNSTARDTRRQATVTETRNTQPRNATTSQAREPQARSTGITQSRNTQQRSTNAAQARDTRRHTTVAPAAVAPARDTRRQEAVRQAYRPAPARTERAPAPQQNRAAHSPPPRTQPSSSSPPPRSQERSSSGGRSERSERSERSGSNARQSRSADRER